MQDVIIIDSSNQIRINEVEYYRVIDIVFHEFASEIEAKMNELYKSLIVPNNE